MKLTQQKKLELRRLLPQIIASIELEISEETENIQIEEFKNYPKKQIQDLRKLLIEARK